MSLCLAALGAPVHAAPLHWDGSSTGPDADGGAGTWSTAADPANWDSAASAGSDVPWTDGSEAIFGGTGGGVAVSGTVNASSLRFAAGGYSTTGGTIVLAGTPVIDVAGNDVTLASILSGSAAITKTGDGTLTLAGQNSFSGTLTVSAGTVKAGRAIAFGTNGSGTIVAAGATLDLNGYSLGSEPVTITGSGASGASGAGALVNNGAAAVTQSVRGLTFGGSASLGGSADWSISGVGGSFQMGGHTLTKTGPSSVRLTGITVLNPGQIDIQQGRLHLDATSLGGSATNKITVRSGAALAQSNNDLSQPWTVGLENNSTWSALAASSTWAGPITVAGSTTIDVAQGATLTHNGIISGPGSVHKTGPGTWTLAAQNTFTGGTTVNAGTLELKWQPQQPPFNSALRGTVTVNQAGTLRLANSFAMSFGFNPVTALNLNGGLVDFGPYSDRLPVIHFQGGTLQSNGGVADRAATGFLSLSSSSVINALAAANPAVISGRLSLSGTVNSPIFNVEAGDAAEGLRVDAAITESSPGAGLRKRGPGVMSLNGPALHAGTTLVEAGTLLLGAAGELAASPVVVQAGASFGTIAPGKTLKSIVANDGSTLLLPAVADSTTTLGAALDLTGGSIAIAPLLGAGVATGSYDLITADSITGTGVPVLDLSGAFGPTRATGTLAVNGNKLQLTLTGTGSDLVWNNASAGGAADGTWDSSLANFTDGVSNDAFQAFDSVTFDDTVAPGSTRTIALAGRLAPAQLNVNNSNGDIVFTSTGSLAGAGSLRKTGSGKLTLSGPVSYAMGGTIMAAGGVLDFSGQAIRAGSLTLADGGAFNNATATLGKLDLRSGSSNAALRCDAGWTKTTPGAVTLTGASALGPGTVAAGMLTIGNPAAPDAVAAFGTAPVEVAAGATFRFASSASPLSIPNTFSGPGTVHFLGGNTGTNSSADFIITGDHGGHTGETLVAGARVTVNEGFSLGSGPLRVGARGAIQVTNSRTLPNEIRMSGGGYWATYPNTTGGLTLKSCTLTGPIILEDGVAADILNSWTLHSNRIEGPISESGGPGGVNFSGPTILTGASTYTGPTTISYNTTRLDGSLGATAVTVGSNGAIKGSGSIGAGGSLTFSQGATLGFRADGNDPLTVGGNVNLGGLTYVSMDYLEGPPTASGPVPILHYTGTLTGSAANLYLISTTQFRTATFAFPPGMITLDLGTKNLNWTGPSSAVWTVASGNSWNNGADSFYTGDRVFFGNRSTSVQTLTGFDTVNPGSMTFNNSTTEYRVSTVIGGPGRLVMNGTGKVVLSGNNTFAGGSTVNAGVLESSSNGLGTGPVTVAAGAKLMGNAYIFGPLTVHGTVDPSVTGSSATTFIGAQATTIRGTYICNLTLNGNDRLSINGDLDIAGATLALSPNGSLASGLDSYKIAGYNGSLIGSFATISGMPAGYTLRHLPELEQLVIARLNVGSWAAAYPGTSDTTAGGDPDQDGIPNLLEFALGSGHPGEANPAILPAIELTADHLVFRYKRNDESFFVTTQTVQWSPDAQSWTDIPVDYASTANVQIVQNGTAPDDVTVTIPRAPGKMLVRLKVMEK